LTTSAEGRPPRTGAGAGTKNTKKKAKRGTGAKAVAGAERRPPRRSSRALQAILDELDAAKVKLAEVTGALRAVDARIRAWDRSEAFLERRARMLHEEATTRFAQGLDGLHALLVRLADRSEGPAFSSRLRAAGTRRLQARVHRELRVLQRAFEGGGAILARTFDAFDDQASPG
jgi:hypothetical protein